MKSRSYGIDLLKSVSMLMVVILHVLGVGGILNSTQAGSNANSLSWFLETLNICAVNCFGLVSGYVLSRGHYRRSRLLSLWLRVVFESLIITAIFTLAVPSSVSSKDWVNVFTPVLSNVYWYFTAYFALFFFVPYTNKMLRTLSPQASASLAISIVLVFTIMGNAAKDDIFHLHGGYGFLWLLCLYLLGGCIRNINLCEKISKYWFLAAYFLSVTVSFAIMKFFEAPSAIAYTSPFTLLSAVSLLMFFKRLEFSSSGSHKFISMLARTSFGVYIIHTNPLIWRQLLTNRFVSYLNLPLPLTFAAVIASAVCIYSICTLCDWLAEKFFKLVHIEKLELLVDSIGKNRRIPQNTP